LVIFCGNFGCDNCEVEVHPATDVENDTFGFNESRKLAMVINRSAHAWPGETGANILEPDCVSLAVSLDVLFRPVDVRAQQL
jgi:hypothetical protein